MMKESHHQGRIGFYAIGLIILWLFLWFGVVAAIVSMNLQDAKNDLISLGDDYTFSLNNQFVRNETILKGFAALFGAVGCSDPAAVRRYVGQIIKDNPQIFSLEIVEKVSREHLAEFIRRQRLAAPDFALKTFTYGTTRKWLPPVDKADYYPIVFMEPMRPGAEAVLGLDIDSIPFLKHAMYEAIKDRKPTASRPFTLVEGNRAYVIFYPILAGFPVAGTACTSDRRNPFIVDIVVDTAKLAQGIRLVLNNGDSVSVFQKDHIPDSDGALWSIEDKSRSALETRLFPSFTYEKVMQSVREPFVVRIRRQTGWDNLNFLLLGMVVGLALLSTVILAAYLLSIRRQMALRIANENQLWQLANHDVLTGLPNRLLLMDRLRQLIARVNRQNERLAIMFIDINRFKEINDGLGHDAGDHVLRTVADRLLASVRLNDTVARIGGDEFVIVIECPDAPAIETVAKKIEQLLAEGVLIDGFLVVPSVSIGVSIYPDDGDNMDALLRHADKKMYAGKYAQQDTRADRRK